MPKNGKVRCSQAGRELSVRRTSRAGRALAKCVGDKCSSAGWQLSVIGSSRAGRRLRACGPLGRRSNPGRKLRDIARDIERDWESPYYGAVPYINAMRELGSVDDYYGMDPGDYVVVMFLANAARWRGPVAREIKQELRDMIAIDRRDNPGDDEDDDGVRCPVCGGPSRLLGDLGDLRWYRCKHCGMDHNVAVPGSIEEGRRRARPSVRVLASSSASGLDRIGDLLDERLGDPHEFEVRAGSPASSFLARRRLKPKRRSHGREVFEVSKRRATALVASAINGDDPDAYEFARDFLRGIDVELG